MPTYSGDMTTSRIVTVIAVDMPFLAIGAILPIELARNS